MRSGQCLWRGGLLVAAPVAACAIVFPVAGLTALERVDILASIRLWAS